jgi:hypothetical protein
MATILLLISLLAFLPTQGSKSKSSAVQAAGPTPSECWQPETERESLMREAEERQYMVWMVTFWGDTHTRDSVLRRRMINLTGGGDVFTRENLVNSLKNVSRLKKVIYPVGLSDVKVSLDRERKTINIDICFREKRR